MRFFTITTHYLKLLQILLTFLIRKLRTFIGPHHQIKVQHIRKDSDTIYIPVLEKTPGKQTGLNTTNTLFVKAFSQIIST